MAISDNLDSSDYRRNLGRLPPLLEISGMGPKITIKFSDANGLKPGETPLQYRGVVIGLVEDVSLNDTLHEAQVSVRLNRSVESLAKKGSAFWIVRPEIGANYVTGLGTVFSGPYLNVLPGGGESASELRVSRKRHLHWESEAYASSYTLHIWDTSMRMLQCIFVASPLGV